MTEKTANKISKVRLESIWLIIIDIRPLIDSVKRNHNNLFISLIKLLSFIIIFSYFFCALYQYAEKWLRNIIFWKFLLFFCDEVCKNLIVVVATIYSRYTLTWNEGTRCCLKRPALDMIYPHMKWGNAVSRTAIAFICDIPSYEMREPSAGTIEIEYRRYTLIWDEGTSVES